MDQISVVHGDDLSPDTLEEVFGAVVAAGKLRLASVLLGAVGGHQ